MQREVGAHFLAGLIIDDAVALFVTEPELGIVVVPFTQAFGLEDVLKDGFPEDALYLALAFQGLCQVFCRGADGLGLLLQVFDRLVKLGLDGGALLGMRLLLGLEGFFHILDVLVQATGDDLHGFSGLLF